MTTATIEIGKLAAALAKAQGKIEGAKKDSTNPHFKSKYADLASIWDACRQALSENEIAVIQSPEVIDGLMVLKTTIAHSSGESMTGTLLISAPANATAQQVGSAITYARRYSLASMVGVAPDDDDDGNSATDAAKAKQASAPVTIEQAIEIDQKISEVKADKAKFLNYFGVNDVRQIKAVDYQRALASLAAKVAKP